MLGKVIEPAIRPLGYDWKIGIALITSFAAREVFVGTIATIYSVGNTDDEVAISSTLAGQTNGETGKKTYTMAVVLSLLVFYAFAMQCISTLAVTYRETKSLKWPVVQFLYMSGFAYLMSLIIFQIFK
jgi:ferrous iron transport protein B